MPNPTYNTVTVTTAATLVLAANNSRKGCLIRNTGTPTIYLGFTSSVTSSNGMPLATNDVLNDSGTNDDWRGSIYAVAASATSDVRYWEW